jgi:hypothetical protein
MCSEWIRGRQPSTLIAFGLIAAAVELRRPPSRKWSWAEPACQATPVALLFALAVVAVVLLMRSLSG